jgi:hypothetical protein
VSARSRNGAIAVFGPAVVIDPVSSPATPTPTVGDPVEATGQWSQTVTLPAVPSGGWAWRCCDADGVRRAVAVGANVFQLGATPSRAVVAFWCARAHDSEATLPAQVVLGDEAAAPPGEPSGDPAVIGASEVTLTGAWTDGTRTFLGAQVVVAGVEAGDQLEWRIDTVRVNGAWQNCPIVSGVTRSLSTASRSANLPGNHPYGHFDDDEERFAIRFRKKVGANPWSAPSPKVRLDPPASQTWQPTALASTPSQLRSAITAGFASSAHYVIHVTAEMAYSGSDFPHFTDLTKAGGALVIRSANRTDPPRFRGFTGDLFRFTNCDNFVLDRLNVWNDRLFVSNLSTADGTPVGDGNGMVFTDCTRFAVENCMVRRTTQGFRVERSQHFAFFHNEVFENGHDNVRIWIWNLDGLFEGNYVHGQIIDQGRADTTSSYHPDGYQMGQEAAPGHRRIRFRREVIIGNQDGSYLQGMLLSSDTNPWPDIAIEVDVADCYVECTKPVGLKIGRGVDSVIRRCVGRAIPNPHGYPLGCRLRIQAPCANITIDGASFPGPVLYEAGGGLTAADAEAATLVGDYRNANTDPSWPSWWPTVPAGQDRRLAHKPGPDAYRF